MTRLDPNMRVGRPAGTDTTTNTGGADNSARVRGRVGSPVYSAADRTVANEVRTKLSSGVFDSNPQLKSRVVNLLATLDTALRGGVARVPDRNNINSVMDALRAINSGSAEPIRTRPAGEVPPFEVTPLPATDGAESVREVSFRWDYGDDEITGFRLYCDGEPVCEFNSPSARSGSCDISTTDGSHTFHLTAFNAAGLESDFSNPAVRNFTPDPE